MFTPVSTEVYGSYGLGVEVMGVTLHDSRLESVIASQRLLLSRFLSLFVINVFFIHPYEASELD
jgi:hypothetical protein